MPTSSLAPGSDILRTRHTAIAVATYALMVVALLWPALLAGNAFIPSTPLQYVHPWARDVPSHGRLQWNPLQYDALGQYYVFRAHAVAEVRNGRLPLWNPFQLCGTPFAANNLSAVYYPPNIIHLIMGAARGAGWSAALHLFLCAMLTRAFLLRLRNSYRAALIGGIIYAFSLWQVCWLQLPPFLGVACWLPAILLLVSRLTDHWSPRDALMLSGSVALALLAGHMQIAFYVLGTGAAWTLWLLCARQRRHRPLVTGALLLGAGLLGVALASPQLLPSLELSRYSHRTGTPTEAGYAAYVAYAVHPAALATLALPDAFGNPSKPATSYAGFSRGGMYFNYAEGALYVGILTIMLIGVAAYAVRRNTGQTAFAALLVALAIPAALGAAICRLAYFAIPGFGQSGSPGRVLVIWCFAAAWLAAAGMTIVDSNTLSVRARTLAVTLAAAVLALAVAVGGLLAAATIDGYRLEVGAAGQQLALAALSVLSILWTGGGSMRRIRAALPACILAADLIANGASYNSFTRGVDPLPEPQVVAYARERAGHDRVLPINTGWSFMGPSAVLPPNLATHFRFRDVQGYDSLLPGQAKRRLAEVLGRDPSPPEVGNIVFVSEPQADVLAACGVRIVVASSPTAIDGASVREVDGLYLAELRSDDARARATTSDGRKGKLEWLSDDANIVTLRVGMPRQGHLVLADQYWPGWHAEVDGQPASVERDWEMFRRVSVPAGEHVVTFRYKPATTYVGIFLACAAAWLAALVSMAFGSRAPRRAT